MSWGIEVRSRMSKLLTPTDGNVPGGNYRKIPGAVLLCRKSRSRKRTNQTLSVIPWAQDCLQRSPWVPTSHVYKRHSHKAQALVMEKLRVLPALRSKVIRLHLHFYLPDRLRL